MIINFESDIQELSTGLKKVEGYLACERLIIQNIQKYIEKGFDDPIIENYLKKVSLHIEDIITVNHGTSDCTNYRYAGGFLNFLFRTPCWGHWINTIKD
jgi:hypothetical protein